MEITTQYWWEHEQNRAHDSVFAVIRHLNQTQGWVRESHIRNMRLYGNLNTLGLNIWAYSQNASIASPHDRLAFNVIQSMVDTVTQKIAKNKPRPLFLTEGGDFKLQSKAKKLNKFIDGQFYSTQVYSIAPDVFRDGAVFGSGFLKLYAEGNKIKAERVFAGEILVDEADGVYGNPRSQYQVKLVPRDFLLKLHPTFKHQIMSAPTAQSEIPGMRNVTDNIWIAEAWHLPSSETSNDGRHIICIETATILDEDYKKPYFPFVKFDWSKRLLGYLGQGLSEQLTGIQVEINKTLRTIQLAFHLNTPRWFLEYGSKIIKQQMTNEVGSFVFYQGQVPQYHAPAAVSDQMFGYLENLFNKAYQISGISSLSAQAKKPEGLNSGKALREFDDIESERFAVIEQNWENFFLNISKQMIDLAKDISEQDPSFEVMVKAGDCVERIKWKEINLDADQYMMQAYPTSFLSKTPSGKLQDITELSQAGMIDQKNAMRLLDFPDLKAYTKFETASLDDLYNQAERIVEYGDYQPPEPFQDLQTGIKIFQSVYLWARNNSVPADRKEMLSRWMSEAVILLQKQQAPPQQQIPMQQAMPAKPMTAPTSDLMAQQGVVQ